jgi:hypothetical protein
MGTYRNGMYTSATKGLELEQLEQLVLNEQRSVTSTEQFDTIQSYPNIVVVLDILQYPLGGRVIVGMCSASGSGIETRALVLSRFAIFQPDTRTG